MAASRLNTSMCPWRCCSHSCQTHTTLVVTDGELGHNNHLKISTSRAKEPVVDYNTANMNIATRTFTHTPLTSLILHIFKLHVVRNELNDRISIWPHLVSENIFWKSPLALTIWAGSWQLMPQTLSVLRLTDAHIDLPITKKNTTPAATAVTSAEK